MAWGCANIPNESTHLVVLVEKTRYACAYKRSFTEIYAENRSGNQHKTTCEIRCLRHLLKNSWQLILSHWSTLEQTMPSPQTFGLDSNSWMLFQQEMYSKCTSNFLRACRKYGLPRWMWVAETSPRLIISHKTAVVLTSMNLKTSSLCMPDIQPSLYRSLAACSS